MGTTGISLLISIVFIFVTTTHSKNFALETNEVSDHFVSRSINFLFDLFLGHYTHKMVKEGKTQLQLENFDRSFDFKFLSLDVEGAVEIEDGWCGNISTLHRTGEADMTKVNEGFILSTSVGLKELKIDFNRYDLSFLGVHQKGKIHVTVGDNSLFLKLSVQLKPTCVIKVLEFKFERLENINLDITNLGPFESLTDEITSWVINEVKGNFKSKIENAVLPELAKAILKADLCHYMTT